MAEEVDNEKGTGGQAIINKMETVDSFVKEIFTIQRYKYNQLTYDTSREIEKITAKVAQLESQVNFLEDLYGSREHLKDRQGQLEEYLGHMSNELFKNKITLNHNSSDQPGPTTNEGTNQLKSIILSLNTKIEEIDCQKTQLQKTYHFSEQTAQ